MKCGATTVRAAANGLSLGEYEWAVLRPHLEPNFRGIVRPHKSDLWTYACTTCGYVELHVMDPAALAYVTENWLPVPVVP